MERISKHRYYINIAEAVSMRSTCLRRHYGAVIVKDDRIISTGYNGSPKNEPNCVDLGVCNRDLNDCEKGSGYLLCPAVHAEMNAIINASKNDLIKSTLYIAGVEVSKDKDKSFSELESFYADPCPCSLCRRMIVNAGIHTVIGMLPDGSIAEIDFKEPKNIETGQCSISYVIEGSLVHELDESAYFGKRKGNSRENAEAYMKYLLDREYGKEG